MATNVILPALGMSQDTGKIVHWLKAEGEQVIKGEPLVEVETDKATVEIEAPVDGLLARVVAGDGDEVPVGQVIAVVMAPGEGFQERAEPLSEPRLSGQQNATVSPTRTGADMEGAVSPAAVSRPSAVAASLLASRIAAEHHVDLSQVKSAGQRVQKADVLAYLQNKEQPAPGNGGRLQMASPKARRLAREQGKDLAAIKGTGPGGAVLAADVLAAQHVAPVVSIDEASNLAVSSVWRIMAERTTRSWNEVPHFYLAREVNASRMIAWREYLILERGAGEITYTDLLVKIVASALRQHPRLNSTWNTGRINLLPEIHLGLAVAVEEGLVVPVIHQADRLGLRELARQRKELVAKARAGKLRPQDISGGTFTISNLGMYGVDTFNAIINQPQAAILAVGRIAERVVPVNGQPLVQPMVALTLSCDHRAVDGARGAQFLETVAEFIEEPLGLLEGASI